MYATQTSTHLEMPQALKQHLKQAASREGIPTNEYIRRKLAEASNFPYQPL